MISLKYMAFPLHCRDGGDTFAFMPSEKHASDIHVDSSAHHRKGAEASRPARRSLTAAAVPGQGLEWVDEPSYVISVAARMVGVHAQTLRYYERVGLVSPARSKGNIRLYRRSDIDRLRLIQRLMSELGVNLAGVDVILRLQGRIRSLESEVERLGVELEGHRSRSADDLEPAAAAPPVAATGA